MKLWIDDIRPAPEGYFHIYSVNQAKKLISLFEMLPIWTPLFGDLQIEVIDIDHDAGDHACEGGDFIKLLEWMEATGRNYPIHIHSMNIVGVQNMRAIIKKNGWKEV